MIIDEDGDFEIKYDYDHKPNFEMEPEDEEYLLDHQEFTRDIASTPNWLIALIKQ